MLQSRDVDRSNQKAVKEANMYYFIESGRDSDSNLSQFTLLSIENNNYCTVTFNVHVLLTIKCVDKP